MNVMAIARSIGLVTDDRREVSGTIDEAVVLASISDLATASPWQRRPLRRRHDPRAACPVGRCRAP